MLLLLSIGSYTFLSSNNDTTRAAFTKNVLTQKIHDMVAANNDFSSSLNIIDPDPTSKVAHLGEFNPSAKIPTTLSTKIINTCGPLTLDPTKQLTLASYTNSSYASCAMLTVVDSWNADNANDQYSVNFRNVMKITTESDKDAGIFVSSNTSWLTSKALPGLTNLPLGDMNNVIINEGRLPTYNSTPNSEQEVMLTPYYLTSNNLKIGGTFTLQDTNYKIVGTGYLPDLPTYSQQFIGDFHKTTFAIFAQEEYSRYISPGNFLNDQSWVNTSLKGNVPFAQKPVSSLYGTLAAQNLIKSGTDNFYLRSTKANYNVHVQNQDEVNKINNYFMSTNLFKSPQNETGQKNTFFYDAYDSSSFGSPASNIGRIVNQLSSQRTTTNILVAVFLGIAAVIMSISIKQALTESQRQYGVMKSSGYTRGQISVSFLPFALFPSIIGCTLGWVVGFLGQSPVNAISAKAMNIPIDLMHFELTTLIVAILVPVIVLSLFVFIIGIYQLRMSSIKLLSGQTNDKTNALASKVSLLVDRINAPFAIKIRSAFLFKSLGKLFVIFLSIFISSTLLTFTFVGVSTFQNFITFSTLNKNYNYSYTLDPNQLWYNQDGQASMQLEQSGVSTNLNVVDSWAKLQTSLQPTNLNQPIKPFTQIVCAADANKQCWFENNLPNPQLTALQKLLEGAFPKDDKFNQQTQAFPFLTTGSILFNAFNYEAANASNGNIGDVVSNKLDGFSQDGSTKIEMLGMDKYVFGYDDKTQSLNNNFYNMIDFNKKHLAQDFLNNTGPTNGSGVAYDPNTNNWSDATKMPYDLSKPIPVFVDTAAMGDNGFANNGKLKLGDTFKIVVNNYLPNSWDNSFKTNNYTFVVKGVDSYLASPAMYVPKVALQELAYKVFGPDAQRNGTSAPGTATRNGVKPTYDNNWILSRSDELYMNINLSISLGANPAASVAIDPNIPQIGSPFSSGLTPIEDIILTKQIIGKLIETQQTIFGIISALAGTLAFFIILVSTTSTINSNKRIIAIMHTLGYSNGKTNSIFVGMYIPIVAVAIAIGIPVGLLIMKFIIDLTAGSNDINLPIIVGPLQVILTFAILGGIYFISYFLTWLSAKRVGYLKLVMGE